jgi:hypothetical protein|tara:strand:+ start:154 stop:444 length:291 start_codon:yes stop_codon:yes gene_type:complete
MALYKKVAGIRIKLTPTEVAAHLASEAEAAIAIAANRIVTERNERNILLAESDWTRMDDNGLSVSDKEAWATYRQALRNLPDQEGFPYEVTYPTRP